MNNLPLIAVLAFAVPVLLPGAGASANEQFQEVNRYIGAAKCKNCHQAKESGDQYGVWLQEKHPKAFETLASDKAKAYAKERGIADPQKSEKCLKCHVTAYGEPKENLHRSFDPKLGVQCETCHGPGEKHLKARMAAAAEEEQEGEKKPAAYTAIPDDEVVKSPPMKTCLQCHNDESPGFKPFCFHKAAADIRHVNPQKPRTAEEKAAILVCGCGECACRDGCADGCGVPPKDGGEPKK
jgi:hypothetical protein